VHGFCEAVGDAAGADDGPAEAANGIRRVHGRRR
jgi:hypothetical protein